MNPLEALAAMFAADLAHARRVADAHRLDEQGRCVCCHSAGPSSGRTFGCTLGTASRAAIASVRHSDAGLPSPTTQGQGGAGDPV